MKKKHVFVVVDECTPFFSPRIKHFGHDCVHVQSSAVMPEWVHFSTLDNYLANIIHEGDIEKTIAALEPYHVDFVLCGEMGVELADCLTEKMGLPTNGTRLSEARRDKYRMIETVKAAGLRTADQCVSDDLEVILSWVRDRGRWPVVLKPVKSSGTDHVCVCQSEEEVKKDFQEILGSRNVLGIRNEEVLVQSFLEGTEYVVNTVSREGRHYVSDVWEYNKIRVSEGERVYDYARLLPIDDDCTDLIEYALGVLDALGIRYGAAHSEIIRTDAGPALVECGARPMGAVPPEVIRECTGRDQVDMLIASYASPAEFHEEMSRPFTLKKHFLMKLFIVDSDGALKEIPGLSRLRELPSYHSEILRVQPGERITRTVDYFTSPGQILLVHEDHETVFRDYRMVCELERGDLFRIEP